MKTQNSKSMKRHRSYKFSRLSVVGTFTFVIIIVFTLFIVFMISEANDFPPSASLINVEQSLTRGEYRKIYSNFLNEMNKFKYWQAYKYAVKLQGLKDEEIQSNAENKGYIEFIAQAVPKDFKDYAENVIDFDTLVKNIKNQYLKYYPNKEQAEAYLKYGNFDNTLVKHIPDYVLASGLESEISAERGDFRDYVEFFKLRIHTDFDKEQSAKFTKLIDENFYTLRQFFGRPMLRNFGRRLLKLPEKYTYAEKEHQITFAEKVEYLKILFAFICDNVSVVNADRTYIPAYPLDTLYRGFGDLESVNYLFSDLISAVLDVNSFQISFEQYESKPLVCLLYDEKLKRNVLYGFDFLQGIPLINNLNAPLDLIAFCRGKETENTILTEYCPYIAKIREGGEFNPTFFANSYQMELNLALYLNNKLQLDVRPLPSSGKIFTNDVLLKNAPDSSNIDEIYDVLNVWGDLKPNDLGLRLLLLTNKENLGMYFNALTSSKAAKLNLSTRKIAFIFGWNEDASTQFSNAETEYMTNDHSDRYIRDYNMLMFSSIDHTAGLTPFSGSAYLFSQTLIENYRQFKIAALQALYQSGLMYMDQGKIRKASVCFADFVKQCEAETEIALDPSTFPGVFVNQSRFLLAKCKSLLGNQAESTQILDEMIESGYQTHKCKYAKLFGFVNYSSFTEQTQDDN